MAAQSTRRLAPTVMVLSIVVLCIVGFFVLWSKAGGATPGGPSYRISFRTDDVKNLQPAGDVRIAGVLVGKVVDQSVEGDRATVQLEIRDDIAPLHDGATVRIGLKSVIGQSFVEIRDGDGAELPSSTVLENDAVVPAVEVDEIVNTFDAKTQKSLSNVLQRLGAGTKGRSQSIDQLMRGIGMIGREGYTAIDAIEAQNADLKALVNEGNTVLEALNTGRDQISSLVTNAQKLTRVTASQSDDLAATVNSLPGLVRSAGRATATLEGLAADLGPVAADLDAAAPGISDALVDLPSVTRNLRALLPYMDSSFGRAPQTLDQVPALADSLMGITPDLETLLANVNPMVEYLGPYATDIGSFFGNFGSSFDGPVENGVRPVRLAPIFSEYSLRNIPLDLTTLNPLHWNNPYPAPMTADDPRPYRGKYPRVTREK